MHVQVDELIAGEVGYLAASIKAVADARVGDTITLKKKQADEALAGLVLMLLALAFLVSLHISRFHMFTSLIAQVLWSFRFHECSSATVFFMCLLSNICTLMPVVHCPLALHLQHLCLDFSYMTYAV